jgi:adenosine deaminase
MNWELVPELIGFFNKEDFNLYKNSKNIEYINSVYVENKIKKINEIWLVGTEGSLKSNVLNNIYNWKNKIKNLNYLKIKFFLIENLNDINTLQEAIAMKELLYRIIKTANEIKKDKLYISLVGGRKTMSSDIYSAAKFFGCDAIIHILDNITSDYRNIKDKINLFSNELDEKFADIFLPVIVDKEVEKNNILQYDKILKKINNISIDTNNEINKIDIDKLKDLKLINIIENELKNANNLSINFHKDMIQENYTSTFRLLYSLTPSKINELKNYKIANNIANKSKDIEWIRKLPKIDLHYHLGGNLYPEDMIRVSKEIIKHINFDNKEFNDFYLNIADKIKNNNIQEIRNIVSNPKNLRNLFNIPEPYNVAKFISLFENNVELLYEYIYKEKDKEKIIKNWVGQGIDIFEKRGDLQGSGLIQNEVAIREICKIIKENCKKNNIKYLEIRCSPFNYTRGGLSEKDVINIIVDELSKDKFCYYGLIIIGSRHRDLTILEKHINLVRELIKDEKMKDWIVGFDLAGAESQNSPKKFRENFLKLMEESINITIHAGEGEEVQNIWEAVYHLNADRIGHGLTLYEDKKILRKFIDRKISIELCPTSNYQIVGYKDYILEKTDKSLKDYPILNYLNEGLRVTINTDDLGICLTDLTNEYYKAASMVKGGISKWDIIRLIRNSAISMFISFNKRRDIILAMENEILELINN